MSTFVLHHPDVVVMELDQKTGNARVFVGFSTDEDYSNVYEFAGRVKGRLDDLPPRLRRHWLPHGSKMADPPTHRENAPDSRDAT